VVVGGGTGWSVQDQPAENGDCVVVVVVVVVAAGASHSDSAW